MSKMQKNVLMLLASIAVCIFLILFSYIGYILLQQSQGEVANNNTAATSQPLSLSQPSATPQPSVQPTLLPTATNTDVVTPTPVEATATAVPTATNTRVVSPTPLAPVSTLTPSFVGNSDPTTQGPVIVITQLNVKGEYVDIQNRGTQTQDITGWMLRSERGNQDCVLSGIIEPGQTLRIWARQADVGRGGFNCGYEENIWNNYESDPAVLFDTQRLEIDRR